MAQTNDTGNPTPDLENFSVLDAVRTQSPWPHCSSRPEWSSFVHYIVSKASKRGFLLRQLKRASIRPTYFLWLMYSATVIVYACKEYYHELPLYPISGIQEMQERCLKIIYPDHASCICRQINLRWDCQSAELKSRSQCL